MNSRITNNNIDAFCDSDSSPLISETNKLVSAPSESVKHEDCGSSNAHTTRVSGYLISATLFSAISGFLFGYDTGVVSGAMISLELHLRLTSFYKEMIVSIALVAAALSSLVAGMLSDWIGRKKTILTASVLFTGGSVLMGASPNKELLLVGRVITGLAIGIASMSVPVYIAEISPKAYRGRLVSINVACISGGQVISNIVDGIFYGFGDYGWRYMLGLGAVPSLVQLLGFAVMPETPRWFVMEGRIEEARQVIMRIRGISKPDRSTHPVVETELNDIIDTLHNNDTDYSTENDDDDDDASKAGRLQQHAQRAPSNWRTFVDMLRSPGSRRALIIACGMLSFQQLGGINTVMYYSATILSMAGVQSGASAIWLSVPVAFTNFAGTLIGLALIDRVGRRPLILTSLACITVFLALLGMSFQFAHLHVPRVARHPHAPSPPHLINSSLPDCNVIRAGLLTHDCDQCIAHAHNACGFCFDSRVDFDRMNGSCLPAAVDQKFQVPDRSAFGRCANSSSSASPSHSPFTFSVQYCPSPRWVSSLILTCMILYILSFSIGMGLGPWSINSEIFPMRCRALGASLASASNWLFNVIISFTFLSLTEAITRYGTFYLYAGVAFCGFVFAYALLIETKGKTLEQITAILNKKNYRRF